MRRSISIVFSIAIISLLTCSSSFAQGVVFESPSRDTAFHRLILDELAAKDTTAVRLFDEATDADEQARYGEARQKYGAVLDLVPGCDHAHRRMFRLELVADNPTRALYHADLACKLDSSAYNKMAVAIAVVAATDEKRYNDALNCAWDAYYDLPEDSAAPITLLNAAYLAGNAAALRVASEKLITVMPGYPQGHFFHGLMLAEDGKWQAAEKELLLSKELGMPPAAVDDVLASANISANARIWRWGQRGIWFAVAWALVMVLLFASGAVLSRMTMRAVERTQASGQFTIQTSEARIRKLYRTLIMFTSRFFYLSLPVMFLLVLVLGGGLLYGMFALGRVPVKLAAIVGIGTLITLYAIIRSAFAQPKGGDPGRRLMQDEAPRLWELTKEVAEKADTRPIDAIFITPGAEVAVYEDTQKSGANKGKTLRCMILGVAAIKDLKVGPFKSILAHEYGHFSNLDTAGGDLAAQTHTSMRQMALTLASNGLANWYNPAWLFINGYHRIYTRISLGASRLQEILADRIAGVAYGASNFKTGLTHVIRQGLTFDRQLNEAIQAGRESFAKHRNLYALPEPLLTDGSSIIEVELKKAINRPTTADDSHPAPHERFALLEKMNLPASSSNGDGDVLQLFNNPDAILREMSDVIHRNVGTLPPEEPRINSDDEEDAS